jgi:hypothetical protein
MTARETAEPRSLSPRARAIKFMFSYSFIIRPTTDLIQPEPRPNIGDTVPISAPHRQSAPAHHTALRQKRTPSRTVRRP